MNNLMLATKPDTYFPESFSRSSCPRGRFDQRVQKLMQLVPLSRAESEVTLLLVEGHSPRGISDIRFRSIQTVRTQIKNVLNKVDLPRTSSLIIYVSGLLGES